MHGVLQLAGSLNMHMVHVYIRSDVQRGDCYPLQMLDRRGF